MKNPNRIIHAGALGFLILASAGGAEPYYGPLRVEGRSILGAAGDPVTLRGVNFGDVYSLSKEGHWNEGLFAAAAGWGARLIRLPIHPANYRKCGRKGYFRLMDQAAAWARKYRLYLIPDWHSIGNLKQGIFLAEYYETTPKETLEFWKGMASRYRDKLPVAFYDLFNEPSAIAWKGGRLAWSDWRPLVEEMARTVLEQDPDAIPLVSGLDFAGNFKGYGEDPIDLPGVAFSAHIYPGQRPQPWEERWEEYFGFMADEHPVILTEFGFDPDDRIMPNIYKGDEDFGRRILSFAKGKGMSWTAFVFYRDQYWPMPLIRDWNFEPTRAGVFFQEALRDGR